MLSAFGAVLMYKTGHSFLMVLAIIAAVGCFWSWGIMHNYATELAKHRKSYTGGFYDITPGEAQSVPELVAGINMGFSLAGLILFIMGLVIMAISH